MKAMLSQMRRESRVNGRHMHGIRSILSDSREVA
jgi:hypothetical protein